MKPSKAIKRLIIESLFYVMYESLLPILSALNMLAIMLFNFYKGSTDLAINSTFSIITVVLCGLQAASSFIHLIFVNPNPWIEGKWYKKVTGIFSYTVSYVSLIFGLIFCHKNATNHPLIIPFILTFTNLVTQAIYFFNNTLQFSDSTNIINLCNFIFAIVGSVLTVYKPTFSIIPISLIHVFFSLVVPLTFLGLGNDFKVKSLISKGIMVTNILFVLFYYLRLKELLPLLKDSFKNVAAPLKILTDF